MHRYKKKRLSEITYIIAHKQSQTTVDMWTQVVNTNTCMKEMMTKAIDE